MSPKAAVFSRRGAQPTGRKLVEIRGNSRGSGRQPRWPDQRSGEETTMSDGTTVAKAAPKDPKVIDGKAFAEGAARQALRAKSRP